MENGQIDRLLSYSVTDFNLDLLKSISLNQLMDLSLNVRNPRISFKASWALEHILLKNTELFHLVYPKLILNYIELNNWSSLRSYTKILMYLLSKENKTYQISSSQQDLIIEKTFTIIEDSECPIAVKVNAFDMLFQLASKHAWIKGELIMIIQFNLEKEATPALRSRGNSILNRLVNGNLK